MENSVFSRSGLRGKRVRGEGGVRQRVSTVRAARTIFSPLPIASLRYTERKVGCWRLGEDPRLDLSKDGTTGGYHNTRQQKVSQDYMLGGVICAPGSLVPLTLPSSEWTSRTLVLCDLRVTPTRARSSPYTPFDIERRELEARLDSCTRLANRVEGSWLPKASQKSTFAFVGGEREDSAWSRSGKEAKPEAIESKNCPPPSPFEDR